jgi:hypothetical protein
MDPFSRFRSERGTAVPITPAPDRGRHVSKSVNAIDTLPEHRIFFSCGEGSGSKLHRTIQMKVKRVILVGGLCTAGFLCGFAGNRISSNKPGEVSVADADGPRNTRSPAVGADHPATGTRSRTAGAKLSALSSTDTLESITALDASDSLYSRLALWLIDASDEDIASYWQSYRQKKDRANAITDLIFINWARLNPQAAITATAGTPDDHYAWWAWACHDPRASLTAAIAANKDRVNNVAWGIGEFQGDWLREHFDEIPESGRDNALRGMTKWDDTDKPEEILEFLKKHGEGFDQRIFATLIRKDPWAAYDWIQNNKATIASHYGSTEGAMELLVKTLGETQPDALQRMAGQTPAGDARRKMEAVLFENLVKTDPDAALEQAEATKAPRIAAERLATVGLSLAQSDPDKALELTQKIFTILPDALDGITWVRYPNGSSGSGDSIEEVDQLVNGLMDRNPAQVLEMIPNGADRPMHGNSTFSKLANRWAENDLVGYTNWVNQQSDPAVRDPAASVVVDQLTQQHQFQEAVEWATSSEKTRGGLFNIFYQWNRTNPGEARAWLDSADLSNSERKSFEENIKWIESQENQ